ncbi:MAG: 2-phospho-L-lactate guanylyltransferase [Gaiellales bacterium]
MIVIPFRAHGKSRLPEAIRAEIALAMFVDVCSAATAVAACRVVTDDVSARAAAAELGALVVDDPGAGLGAAVSAALAGSSGPCAVVNADLPAATAGEIEALFDAARSRRFALTEAHDGTTNALALPAPGVFRSLYGRGSAARFRAHANALHLPIVELDLPGLADDVDTMADLERLAALAGPHTRAAAALVLR